MENDKEYQKEESLENNKDYQGWIEAIQERNWTLASVPEELIDLDMVLIAVKQDGWNLQYVPEELDLTPEIYLEAVKNYNQALILVPENLRTLELCDIAVSQEDLADELLNAFVPDKFKEELAEKYDLYLEPKAKGR